MSAPQLLRRQEVEERLGVSRAYIYEAMKRDGFPRPIRLGPRAVRWRESDLEEWIAAQPEADAAAAEAADE